MYPQYPVNMKLMLILHITISVVDTSLSVLFYCNVVSQDPFVYRLIEAVQHYGRGLKLIANEKKGDGIISAIDLYVSLDEVKGVHEEDRLVVTFNGRLPNYLTSITNVHIFVVAFDCRKVAQIQ